MIPVAEPERVCLIPANRGDTHPGRAGDRYGRTDHQRGIDRDEFQVARGARQGADPDLRGSEPAHIIVPGSWETISKQDGNRSRGPGRVRAIDRREIEPIPLHVEDEQVMPEGQHPGPLRRYVQQHVEHQDRAAHLLDLIAHAARAVLPGRANQLPIQADRAVRVRLAVGVRDDLLKPGLQNGHVSVRHPLAHCLRVAEQLLRSVAEHFAVSIEERIKSREGREVGRGQAIAPADLARVIELAINQFEQLR